MEIDNNIHKYDINTYEIQEYAKYVFEKFNVILYHGN